MRHYITIMPVYLKWQQLPPGTHVDPRAELQYQSTGNTLKKSQKKTNIQKPLGLLLAFLRCGHPYVCLLFPRNTHIDTVTVTIREKKKEQQHTIKTKRQISMLQFLSPSIWLESSVPQSEVGSWIKAISIIIKV